MNSQQQLIDLKNSRQVVKSNNLIQIPNKLSLLEYKLILVLISGINKDDDDFKEHSINIKEFMEWSGVKGNGYYDLIRKTAKNLTETSQEIFDGKKYQRFPWLYSAEYSPNNPNIIIRFHPFLKPYLLKLKDKFTKYLLNNASQIKSVAAIKLYESLKMHEYQKKNDKWSVNFEITKLKETLGLSEKYSNYTTFKRRVLENSQRELKEKTDIEFSFSELKTGRKITNILFKVSLKHKHEVINEDNLIKESLNLPETIISPVHSSIEEDLLALQVNPKIVRDIIKKYPREYLEDKIYQLKEQLKSNPKITNIGAYVATSIRKVSPPAPIISEQLDLIKETCVTEEEITNEEIKKAIDENLTGEMAEIIKRISTKNKSQKGS